MIPVDYHGSRWPISSNVVVDSCLPNHLLLLSILSGHLSAPLLILRLQIGGSSFRIIIVVVVVVKYHKLLLVTSHSRGCVEMSVLTACVSGCPRLATPVLHALIVIVPRVNRCDRVSSLQ